MIEWNIQSRAHTCQSCVRPFADQDPYHTMLFDERQGYARLDVCEACWQSQYSQGARDRKGFVSHWQGTYMAPASAPDPIEKETAESLLRKLVALNDPQHRAPCYILAVMLERKRLLKVKDQLLRDGERVFVYEQPRTGDLFTIIDPRLQLNQLDEVQRAVAHLLEQGLNPPSPTAEPMPVAGMQGPRTEEVSEALPAASSAEPSASETPVEPSAVSPS
jgi:hypothetical protein